MEKIRLEDSPLQCKTDPTRWRLRSEDGRHTWHYLADDATAQTWTQTEADKYFLGLPLVHNQPPAFWHGIGAKRRMHRGPLYYRGQHRHWPLQRMAWRSLRVFSYRQATGGAIVVDL
jgi:hypothetical protein